MRHVLFAQPSPGIKASFAKILGRARGLDSDLRNWCRAEVRCADDILVSAVGMDLIGGQRRLVAQSLFDLLSSRET
jgi:hypothetical protein